MENKLTIGCDPEFATANEKDIPVPVCGLIGGTKEEPITVQRGMFHEDNANVEIGTDPAETEDEFVLNVQTVLKQVDEQLAKHGLKRVPGDLTHYDLRYAKGAFNRAKWEMFGCDPEKQTLNFPMTLHGKMGNRRTASGNLHIGFTHSPMVMGHDIITGYMWWIESWLMPLYIAWELEDKYSIYDLLNNTAETKHGYNYRRMFYSPPTSYRLKEYGLEIRSPSNVWCKNEDRMRQIYRALHEGTRSWLAALDAYLPVLSLSRNSTGGELAAYKMKMHHNQDELATYQTFAGRVVKATYCVQDRNQKRVPSGSNKVTWLEEKMRELVQARDDICKLWRKQNVSW